MDYKPEFIEKYNDIAWDKFRGICTKIQANQKINYTFEKPENLYFALSPKGSRLVHAAKQFERLEFLGDTILDYIIVDHLFRTYPTFNEGELTNYKKSVTDNKSLSILCTTIGLDQVGPILGIGQLADAQKADIMEAFIGAFYIDTESNTKKLADWLLSLIDFSQIQQNMQSKTWGDTDPKSYLQVQISKKYGQDVKIEYSEVNIGSQNDPKFVSTVKIVTKANTWTTEGESEKRKKEAEKSAAEKMIEKLIDEGEISAQ
jgi:ribonuclease III